MKAFCLLVVLLSSFSCSLGTGTHARDVAAADADAENSSDAANGAKYRVTPTPDPKSPTGIYIPETLEDAFVELDKMLTPEFRTELKLAEKSTLAEYHFGLGLWMRNQWRLWGGSSLARSLEKLGLHHPDDMSALIIRAYRRRLNAQSPSASSLAGRAAGMTMRDPT
jgi:hypothetical protein